MPFPLSPGWICVSKLHSKSPWHKSKGMQGTIGPIERARVMDLQSPQDDKPLTPAHRVPLSALSKLKILFVFNCLVGLVWQIAR